MKYFLAVLVTLTATISTVAFAGGTGGGGSPPGIMLPSHQFTEIALGILRGEQVRLRSEDGEMKFDTKAIDSKLSTITIASPETGETVLLQDFDKKFGGAAVLKSSSIKSSIVRKSASFSIPSNPNVTTAPAEDDTSSSSTENEEASGSSGGSPPAETGN